jgi:imidazolonepropionase-like amidohydrolase
MRTGFVLVVVVFCLLQLCLQAQQEPENYAFLDVTLIPMDRERTIPHQTVIVHKSRIIDIKNSNKAILPDDAVRIDGRGMYLIPGLADMHVHAHSPEDLALFVANGVTTVRNMRGSQIHLAYRQLIKEEKLFGPTLYTCGAILDGTPPTGESVTVVETEEQARQIVADQKQAGYDCIKVYTRLSRHVYKALITAAKENNIPVTGHVPTEAGLDLALALRQNSIEHLTGYMGAIHDGNEESVNGAKVVKESDIPIVAKDTASSGVWNCPTLVVQQNYASATEKRTIEDHPELKYVAPVRLAMWDPARERRFLGTDFQAIKRGISVLKKIVYSLHEQGAGLLLGTDAPSRFVVPGFSAHRELKNLVDSGLTPYEALSTATRNPAIFLKASSQFGTIAPGKRADFILLKADPLKNISNTEKIAGVMLRGKWLPEGKLNSILEEVRKSYIPPENRFTKIQDLPSDGTVRKYQIMNSDVVIGEERIFERMLADGRSEIISQQVGDAPFSGTYTAHMIRESDGSIRDFDLHASRPEGETVITIHNQNGKFEAHAQVPHENEKLYLEGGIPYQVYMDFSMAASRTALMEQLIQMKPGEVIEREMRDLDFFTVFNKGFQVRIVHWKISRQYDTTYVHDGRDVPATVFIIEATRKHSSDVMKIVADMNGVPLLIQRGPSLYKRIEDPR